VLHNTNEESFVYVIDKKQNKAFMRTISIGQLVNNRVEITNGLSAGELIVSGGQQKLSNGSFVTITK
jgi:multidrug efflux pump subunit AcrA (membrane-fusion protein)